MKESKGTKGLLSKFFIFLSHANIFVFILPNMSYQFPLTCSHTQIQKQIHTHTHRESKMKFQSPKNE